MKKLDLNVGSCFLEPRKRSDANFDKYYYIYKIEESKIYFIGVMKHLWNSEENHVYVSDTVVNEDFFNIQFKERNKLTPRKALEINKLITDALFEKSDEFYDKATELINKAKETNELIHIMIEI